MSILQIPTARVFKPLLEPARDKVAKGGRGSGKSHFFGGLAVEDAQAEPGQNGGEGLRMVCIREVQKDLAQSSKMLIEGKIQSFGLGEADGFKVFKDCIELPGDGLMIFKGMNNYTADSVKSLEGFKRSWWEEAHTASQKSIDLLRPTIRAPGSQLWWSLNPTVKGEPVDKMFGGDNPISNSIIVEANWRDNPWFTEELEAERQQCLERQPDDYDHIWEGKHATRSDAQVLHGKTHIEDFTPQADWDGPYYGGDFGYSQDPMAAVEVWLHGSDLYIRREAYSKGVEQDDIAAFVLARIPGFDREVSRWDNSRPETVSFISRNGLPRAISCDKWPGSVEDGIGYLRSFARIVIHTDCTNLQGEARLWSYKVDRLTDDVTTKLADGHEHGWDAVRYAVGPMIKRVQQASGETKPLRGLY